MNGTVGGIMDITVLEEFVDTLSRAQQEALSSAIKGKSAFRRFKDSVYQMGFDKKWYAFQAEAFKRKAARWCEENDIEYEE